MSSPLEAYGIRKQRQNLKSKFFRNVHLRATHGMPRREMMMRWLGKDRYMNLMGTMSHQLQSGDSNWIGSLNLIMKLVANKAKKIGYQIPRQKLLKVEKLAQRALMEQHSETRFFKSLEKLDNKEYVDEDELIADFALSLGAFAAYALRKADAGVGFVDFHTVVPHIRKTITETMSRPSSLIMKDTNPISNLYGTIPDADKPAFVRKYIHTLAHFHGFDPGDLINQYQHLRGHSSKVMGGRRTKLSFTEGEPLYLSLLTADVAAHPHSQSRLEDKQKFAKVARLLDLTRDSTRIPRTEYGIAETDNPLPVTDFDEQLRKKKEMLHKLLSKVV